MTSTRELFWFHPRHFMNSFEITYIPYYRTLVNNLMRIELKQWNWNENTAIACVWYLIFGGFAWMKIIWLVKCKFQRTISSNINASEYEKYTQEPYELRYDLSTFFFYFIGSLVQFFSSINAIYTNDGFFTRGMIQKCQISDWNYSSIENLIFEQCQIVLVTIDQIFSIYWVFKLITFIPPTSSLFEAITSNDEERERERQQCQGEFSISRNPNNDNNISFLKK